MPAITGIHHLSLTVLDAAKSEAFYTSVLGFAPVFERPDEDGRGFKRILAHPDTRTIIGFTVHKTNDGSRFSEFRTGLDHLAFGVASHEELEGWIGKLDEFGVEHSPITDAKVGEFVSFRDPDNVQIELWANPA
ncbi:MAG: VOC family protein [Actinomycetota bacterium]